MMQPAALTGLCVFLSWTAVTANSDKAVYKAVGDKVVLTPASVAHPITIIMWKHGLDKATEFYGGETYSYRHFKDHCMLNSSTGALTITGLIQNDSGNYTAEINGQVTNTIQLLVISPVPKPSVSTWCEPDMTYCVFTCEGNTTNAEPVTYKWGESDRPSTKEHNITKEDKEPSFSCTLCNPVSCKKSEVLNPFTTRNRTWVLTCLIPLVGGILFVCVLFFKKCKCRQENSATMPSGQETAGQEPPGDEQAADDPQDEDQSGSTTSSFLQKTHEVI